MNPALWAALGGGAVLLLVLLGAAVTLVLSGRRARGREDAALAAARADVAALRVQVDELSGRLAATTPASPSPQTPDTTSGTASAEFVITSAGRQDAAPFGDGASQVPGRAVLSVTLGEPLVKAAAFGYALRRTLSPESRNRIAFEMRREVKRSRKARRRAARRTRVGTGPTEESAA